jgi:cytochrome c556
MQGTTWIAVGLAVAACHCESAPSSAQMTLPREEAPPASIEARVDVLAHHTAAAALQAAVAQGRLSDARDHALWYVTHDIDGPSRWGPFRDELRDAAMQMLRAHDVPTAGVQLGRVGRACSSCHEAEGIAPRFASSAAPATGHTLEQQMDLHQWAAARLWEGVVGPSDERWLAGARVMAAGRIDVAKSAHEKPNAAVVELAERLRAEASEAVTIIDHGARAAFFGDMMETCASCHDIVRPTPVRFTGEPRPFDAGRPRVRATHR